MENIPLNRAAAEKEGFEVLERVKDLQKSSDTLPDALTYQEAHDQISNERLKEMREYIEITGGKNNPKYHNLIIEFMARNYRVEELKKIGLKSIRLLDEIRYYKTIGEDAGDEGTKIKPNIYTRDEYLEAKDNNELPNGHDWLRTRALSHWRMDDKDFGTIDIFDPFDYPYELPDYVEASHDKDQALLTYLLGHEVGHFVYSSVFLNDDLSPRNDISERTVFGSLLFKNYDGQIGFCYDYIDTFMKSPFTPYLNVRVKAIRPLYEEAIKTQDPKKTDRFMYEFTEYYAEFFSEAAALAKTKNPNTTDDIEKYFVSCYDQAESILNQ